MSENKNEIVLFETKDKEVTLSVPVNNDTVWLTQDQMSELFDTARSSIAYHIGNIFKEGELNKGTSVEIFDRSKKAAARPPQYYNLDVIISVGYRVKSQRGIEFRQWANKVLKQYIMNGYAINEKRLEALNKTVEIQSRIIANTLELEEKEVLRAVNLYTEALILLDQYDHQSLSKPSGKAPIYRITYEDCRTMISHMEDSFSSDVFGVEKEVGKVEGILAAVYQDVFGGEVYPTLEEKAANLLYFMIKDHPFADGCKRIAASLFLEFLDRNNALFRLMVKKMNFCVVLTVVVLTGCTPIPSDYQSVSTDSSTADVADSSEEEASTSATSGSENSLAIDEFEYNGKTISVLNDVPSILEKFGTPDKRELFQPEYQSGRFSYYFDSEKIELNTVEVDGEELPFYIRISDENVKLPKGVHIGCTEEEVKAAYGEPSKTYTEAAYFMCYENEKYELSFTIGAEMDPVDEVKSIEFINVDTRSKYNFDSQKRLSSDVDTVPASGDSANGLAGEEFLYNGKEISVLDKPHEKVIPNLGAPFRIDDLSTEGVFLYYFGSETEHIRLETYTYNGEELTKSLFINDKTIKTNKGIGVGCTTADVLAAYGDPLPPTDKNDFSMCYKFGQYEIAFHRNSKDGDIVSFAYINLDTFEKYLND